jgi:hypothetical protein
LSKVKTGDTVQVAVNAPARYHPLARGVLRRQRVVLDQEGSLTAFGSGNTVLWTVETSEGSTFEVPKTLLARIEDE